MPVSPPTDRQFALMSQAVYQTTAWDFVDVKFHASLIRGDGWVTLSCRGTQNFPDVVADIDVIAPDSFEHPELGIVHAGFERSTAECFDAIAKALGSLDGTELYGTGHSKGGAEMEMLATKLAIAGILLKRVVTFGTPRWLLTGNAVVPPLLAPIAGRSYRHFKDRITEAPIEPWDHPANRQPVQVGTGSLVELLDVEAMHAIANYVATVPDTVS